MAEEQAALGNRGDGATPMNLAQSMSRTIGFCGWLAFVLAVIVRKPGSSGHRTFGIAAVVTCFLLPFVVGSYKPTLPGEPTGDPDCMFAALILPCWAVIHRLLAQRNRGREHSFYVGDTIFCRRCRPLVETVMGLALAYAFSIFSSGMAAVFVISTVANLIHLGAVNARRGFSAGEIFDAELEARQAAQDFKAMRRG